MSPLGCLHLLSDPARGWLNSLTREKSPPAMGKKPKPQKPNKQKKKKGKMHIYFVPWAALGLSRSTGGSPGFCMWQLLILAVSGGYRLQCNSLFVLSFLLSQSVAALPHSSTNPYSRLHHHLNSMLSSIFFSIKKKKLFQRTQKYKAML